MDEGIKSIDDIADDPTDPEFLHLKQGTNLAEIKFACLLPQLLQDGYSGKYILFDPKQNYKIIGIFSKDELNKHEEEKDPKLAGPYSGFQIEKFEGLNNSDGIKKEFDAANGLVRLVGRNTLKPAELFYGDWYKIPGINPDTIMADYQRFKTEQQTKS